MTLHEKIAQARLLAERASEGPWGVDHGLKYTETKRGTRFQHIMGARGAAICNTSHFDEVRLSSGELLSEQRHGKMEDAAFIAESRMLLPALAEALAIAVGALEFYRRPGMATDPIDIEYAHNDADGFTFLYSGKRARESLAQIADLLGTGEGG